MPKQAQYFKKLKDENALKNKVKRTRKAVRGAAAEIRKLMTQSKKGTLHKKRLEAGLKKLTQHFLDVHDHWPHHHGP